MSGPAPVCLTCKFFNGNLDDPKCTAFREGIPEKIWYEADPHTKPVRGDHGITYEAKDQPGQ